ncbi:polysaccharide deacetylase family protein [Candidatus Omnitrophota bacterium]
MIRYKKREPSPFSSKKRVAITFDDGPNGEYTLKIVDILAKYRLKATFFLLGANVLKFPKIARKIAKKGHIIGNHTYSHKHLKRLSSRAVLRQIERSEEVFKEVLGIRPKYLRPPYGEYTKRIEKIVRRKGHKLINWDVDAKDWKNPSSKVIAERILSKVADGSIILLHDGANIRIGESRRNTVNALPLIVRGLRQKGFKIVSLDEIASSPEPNFARTRCAYKFGSGSPQ